MIKNKLKIFFITEKNITDNIILIDGQDFIHLSKVLRYKVGDKIICKTFTGFSHQCEIEKINQKNISCKILTSQKISQEKKNYTKIFLCIPRLEILSSIVMKITELGVDELQCIFSERSYLKKSSKFNLERFKKISLESLKQCGRDIPLLIKPAIHLTSITKKDLGNNNVNLLLWECEQKNKIEQIKLKNRINLFIGSEGGISQQEKSFLTEKLNFQSVSLSQNILRVETAVLFSLSKIL